jgi:hypothetical protein
MSNDLHELVFTKQPFKNHINHEALTFIVLKLGSIVMDSVTTIFGVIIGGFIVVTVMMQLIGRNLPQN